MLYNPKWEIKADPFSLESLIAWLERQPAGGTYDYCDARRCVLCQYFRAVGFPAPIVAMNTVYPNAKLESGIKFPTSFWTVAAGVGDRKWTFGAALKRARAAV